ncbi:MAG: glutaredoxin family protein [Pseudomonadota bacterium]|nr:glutaredoxin family protein [Pseudomonadota bacterium]
MRASIALRAALAALLVTSLHAQAQSTVYRWVDKDGKVQFSDSPPPAEAKDATQRRMGGGYVDEGQVPYATQVATRRYPVVLFVSDDCGDVCAQARALLSKRGVPFSEKNAKTSPEAGAELKKLAGAMQVPLLLVGSNAVKGYLEEEWQSALDEAGYARSRLPGQPGPRPK